MKPSQHIDISILITAHHEGDLLFRTLRSIQQNISYIQQRVADIQIEVLIGLDAAREQTIAIARQFSLTAPTSIFTNNFRDLARNRNFLIKKSAGTYLAIYDGDDFFSENYLHAAFLTAQASSVPSVYVPSWTINFNTSGYIDPIFHIKSSTDPTFSITNCYSRNNYLSQYFAHRAVYDVAVYEPLSTIYAYEDWQWNLTLLAHAIPFIALADVVFFYRRKSHGSLLVSQNNLGKTLAPSPFYSPEVFTSLRHIYSYDAPQSSLQSRPIYERNEAPINSTDDNNLHAFAHTGKQLARAALGKSRLYDTIGLEYRATQQTFAPLLHKIRHNHFTQNVMPIHKQAIKTMFSHRNYETAQTVDVEGYDHEALYRRNRKRLSVAGFDKQHFQLWAQLNAIEPTISYNTDTIINATVIEMDEPQTDKDVYFDFCNHYKNAIDDIVFVPHLIRGGADKAIIHLVETLAFAGRHVLVVATGTLPSSWRYFIDRLPNATFLTRHDDFSRLTDDTDFKIFFLRIIQNWPIKTLTIMNSMLAYQLLQDYGTLIQQTKTAVFVHSYMFDKNDVNLLDFIFPLADIHDNITAIITDGTKYIEELRQIYGWSSNNLIPLPLPINPAIRPTKKHRPTKRLFFAGRIAEQKQIDILLDLAADLEKQDISLDFFGAKDEAYARRIRFEERLKKHKNLAYKGIFSDFSKLQLAAYDALIMPTSNEGMPNIILEALKANLFVITVNVGSISDVTIANKTGFLLPAKDYRNPKAYLKKIALLYKKGMLPSYAERLALNQKRLQPHTLETYQKNVLALYHIEQ